MYDLVMNSFDSFLKPHIGKGDYKVLPLAGDASSRRYYRIVSDEKSWVLMEWEPFDQISDFPFLSVQQCFAEHGVRVPQVIEFCQKTGLFLLEDLGDLTLERRFWEFQNQESILPFYKATIDQLIKIHSLGFDSDTPPDCTAFKSEFSVEKLLWEMNYAKKHLIEGLLQIPLEPSVAETLEQEFTTLCEDLYKSPQVVCHRDFHSRNVMLRYDDFVIIDFQDARLGPPAYDLVSLFCDSYVRLTDDSVSELMDYYKKSFPYFDRLKISDSEWSSFYDLQVIQRCFKACGSFASFKMTRDDNRYLKYIEPTLRRVLAKLREVERFPTLSLILEESAPTWRNI